MKRLLRVLFLALLVFDGFLSYAQLDDDDPDSSHEPMVTLKSAKHYVPYANVSCNNVDPSSCYGDFSFTTYTDDTVWVDAGYRDHVATYNKYWQLAIYNITTGTPYFHSSGGLWTGTLFDLPMWNFPPGVYDLHFFNVPWGMFPTDFHVRLMVVKKIRNVWLEVPTTCKNDAPTDNKFKFKIKTDPPISDSLIFQVQKNKNGAISPDPCLSIESYAIQQICSLGAWPMVAMCSREGVHANLSGLDSLSYYGSKWPDSYPDDGTSVEDYYVKYQEDYMTGFVGMSDIVNDTGSYSIDLFWTNGIDTFIRTAPIIVPGSTYHFGNYSVWGNQYWSATDNPVVAMHGGGTVTDIYIEGTLTIEPWAKLELHNVNLHFGPYGKVIIKNGIQSSDFGGYLYMFQSKLTSAAACGDNYKWQGVEVWGLKTNSQYGSPGSCYQGYLSMSGSTIENARVGVLLGKHGDNKNNYTGGVIKAMYSKFYDNNTAIKFDTYYYPSITSQYVQPNYSLIQTCDFKRTSGAGNYSGYFIVENGIKSLDVWASTFEDVNQHRNIVGIASTNSGLKSVGNVFKGLKNGVRASSFTTVAMGIQVIGNTFENSLNGTTVSALMAPQIVNSTFKVPGAPSLQTTVNYTGLTLSTSTGYLVRNNNFDTYSGVNYFNTGILVQSSGSTDNFIRENEFDDLGVGVLSNYMNTNSSFTAPTGLQLLCNDIFNCKRYVAARGTDTFQHGMRITQGNSPTLTYSGKVADNKVMYAGSTITLYNPANEVNSMFYYWKTGAYKKPITTYGNATRIQLLAPAEVSCPSTGTPWINPSPSGPLYELLPTFMQDSTGGMQLDSLTHYLEAIDDQYADLALVDIVLESGDRSKASTLYDAIATTYSMNTEEEEEFKIWGRKLMDLRIAMMKDSLALGELDSNRVDTLELVATNAKMWARDRAQAWLTYYDDRTFENEMLYPDTSITVEPDTSDLDTGSGGARYAPKHTEPSPIELQKDDANYLYPNPVHDVLNVVYRGSEATLVLTDVTGRVVLKQELKAGENKMGVEKLPAGIYLYRLTEGEQDVMRGKILKD